MAFDERPPAPAAPLLGVANATTPIVQTWRGLCQYGLMGRADDHHTVGPAPDGPTLGTRRLDADTARFLELLDGAPMAGGSVEDARNGYAAAPKPDGDAIGFVDDRMIDGPNGPIPVRLYADNGPSGPTGAGAATDPEDVGGRPILMFFHGGGWVLSSVDGHDALARRMAVATGAVVVSVEYRLAPEHPFPAPHDDCWAATRWLVEHGAQWAGEWTRDTPRVGVSGDSAGANLAAGVALRARDESLPLSCQILIYPCIDTNEDHYLSYSQNGRGFFLTAEDMRWFWHHYVPTRHRADPYAVPARAADVAGVAPALVQTADFDPLRDEGEHYGHRLEAAGVETTISRFPGVVHGFVSRPHLMARATYAHRQIGDFFSQH